MCEHKGPRHLIDKFDDNGKSEQFWMCCTCGEIVGKYKKAYINGCKFNVNTHLWYDIKGRVVSEYA